MDAIENLRQVKNNWSVCSKWELEQQKNDACFEKLKEHSAQTIPQNDIPIFQKKGKTLINAVNTLDQIGINKSENALVSLNTAISTAVQILGGLGFAAGYAFSKLRNSPGKTPKVAGYIGMSICTLIGASVASFISSHFAKTATRIARYQTRNNELKDVRNFVTYTDEQIEIAKKKLSSVKEVKDITEDMSIKESSNPVKVYKKSIESVNELNKDYQKYKLWHKEYLETESKKNEALKNVKLTKKEQDNAEKDKNFILNTIRKLELSTNAYEINTGFALKTLAALLSSLALGLGFSTCWGLGKLAKGKTGMLAKLTGFASKASIPAGIIAMFLAAGPLLKLAKESAKLGRFKERTKLLSDPMSFTPYIDNELEDIKQNDKKEYKHKSVLRTIIDDFKFIPQIRKDYTEYLKYKKDKQQEELKLAEILKTMPISETQLKEAKKLQKQTFMAFEKIDDKSECLVDDTNAAVSSITSFINLTVNCASKLITLALFGKEITKFTANKKMPGFFEGLKLAKNLSFKKMTLIFLVPFIVSKGIMVMASLLGAEIKKKSAKIGIMSATNDLNHPAKFTSDLKTESVFSDFH